MASRNPFRVSILFLFMGPWLLVLVLAIPLSRSNPTRKLLLTSSHGEWREEQLRRLREEQESTPGEHGRKSERKLVVPKGALYNMYYLAHPRIMALFEPVNKTYDYFTFASCFTKTSSRGHVSLLSDDPDLEELLFIDDPVATLPVLDYQKLHRMGSNITIEDIAAAVESTSGKILGPYDAVSHNCAYRLVELGHKLGKMPSSGQEHQIKERDALIQYFAKGLESFGLADILRKNPEALKTLYSLGADDDQAISTVADLSNYTLMKQLTEFTIEAQEKIGHHSVQKS